MRTCKECGQSGADGLDSYGRCVDAVVCRTVGLRARLTRAEDLLSRVLQIPDLPWSSPHLTKEIRAYLAERELK